MKFKFSLLVSFLFFSLGSVSFCKKISAPIENRVRVLLDQSSKRKIKNWKVCSDVGFALHDLNAPQKKIICLTNDLQIVFRNGCFYLNGKRFLKKQFLLTPEQGLIGFNGNAYKGAFLFLIDDMNTAYVINVVAIEDYIFAVLRSESWPGWPLEVNKVFAVAARSYAIAKAREARKVGRVYHIKNTKIHQTYNGHQFQKRNSDVLQQAVDETKGLFLAYDDQPIVAMFDSCCGGIIPSKMEGVDFKKAPYLARDYACEHCKRCKIYRWSIEYDQYTWTKILRCTFPKLKKMKCLRIARRDSAGLIQEVIVKDAKQEFYLTGKQLYSLLDAVKSFCFFICKQGKNIVLKGRGYGHHLGLCQWGAREMVRDGWDYRKILQFYYPDVTFVRLV